MMLLKITTGTEKGRTLELTENAPLSIGRSESSALCIPDKKISRRHAEIVSDGENIFITDLSSRTGTRVNGRPIQQRTPLCIGDTIQIGETDLVLEKTTEVPAASAPRVTTQPETKQAVKTAKPQNSPHLPVYSAQESLVELYSGSMLALAKRVQTRVLELLNIDAAAKEISNSEMRPKVADAVDQILREIRHEIPSSVKLDQFRQILLDDLTGLGPLSPLLRDGSISEIMINGPENIFIESKGLLYRSAAKFNSESHLQAIIQRIVEPLGRHIDAASPMVDARLEDGSLVTIRKFASKKLTDDDLIKFGSLTKPMALFLREAVRARRNILVSGGTGSGKTTLLNILSQFIPEKERIITVEDSAELKLSHENLCRLEARPANVEGQGRITIRDLVINTLRMRPDRIIVGECRGAEALDMLQAMNTGHDGSMTTCHANNPRDALSRLENMVMMAGFELPSSAIREQIASAIHLIVQQTRLPDGSRKIVKISEVTGREGNTILLQDIFTFEQEGFDENFHVIGHHTATGNIPTFIDELRQAGDLELDMSVFVPEG